MEPRWHEYSRNVWSVVAAYIDQWEDDYRRGDVARVRVIVTSDHPEPVTARLRLVTTNAGGEVLTESGPVEATLAPLGQETLEVPVSVPDVEAFVLLAHLQAGDTEMWDRRKVGFTHVGVPVADPPFWGVGPPGPSSTDRPDSDPP